jgi:hypothetical protein
MTNEHATQPTPDVTNGHVSHTVSERLMPWLISVLFHGVIVLLAVFVIWAWPEPTLENQPLVPTLNQYQPPASLYPTPLPFETPRNALIPPAAPPVDRDEHRDANQALISTAGPAIAMTKPRPDATIGDRHSDQPGSMFNHRWRSNAPEAMPRPDSVVYVVDASGSMVEQFAMVRLELTRAIRLLEPDQRFNVVFFRQDRAEAAWRGLRRATPAHRDRAIRWAGIGGDAVVPHGGSNPLEALRTTLSWRPDEIWLLSDNISGSGRFALDPEALLSEIQRMKQRYRADRSRIHAIQFLRADRLHTLERIAGAHGGLFRQVDEADLR